MSTPLIEYAKAGDYAELMDFLHAVFCRNNPNHERFEVLFPDLLLPTDSSMANHAVVRENGRIVSCVGGYPMTLQVGGCRVPLFGIGQVSTAREALGRGYMTALLKAQLARARSLGIPLAWLGGRHDRYSHFGFETVGVAFRYGFDAHSAKDIPSGTHTVARAVASSGTVTQEVFAERGKSVEGLVEPRERYCARFLRGACDLWTATPAGSSKPDAWAVVDAVEGRRGHIEEWWGSEAGRLALLSEMVKPENYGKADREESISDRALNDALRRHCAWMGGGMFQLAVLDPARLLEAYRPLVPADAPLPSAQMDAREFARFVFGPEPNGGFPFLPFAFPNFDHL